MYTVLNTLSEYTYFYISKNITSYTFLLGFKIVQSLQCILKLISSICLNNQILNDLATFPVSPSVEMKKNVV